MASPVLEPTERTRLLSIRSLCDDARLGTRSPRDLEARSASSFVSKGEEALGHTAVGEILPYNDYSSIDFLHDTVFTFSKY
jgi:chloride channel 3/4/5